MRLHNHASWVKWWWWDLLTRWQQWNLLKLPLQQKATNRVFPTMKPRHLPASPTHPASANASVPSCCFHEVSSLGATVSYLLWLPWLWDHTELPSFSMIQLQPSTVMPSDIERIIIYIYLYISMQGHWWFWYNAVSGCVSGNHCDARIGLNIRVWQGFIESKHLHVDVLPLHCIWANRFRLALQLKEIQIFYQKICLADKPPSKELFNRLSTQWCHIIVHYCRVWVWWGAGNLVLTTNSCRVAEVAGTLVGSLHLYQNIMWGHVYPLYTSSFVIINNDE